MEYYSFRREWILFLPDWPRSTLNHIRSEGNDARSMEDIFHSAGIISVPDGTGLVPAGSASFRLELHELLRAYCPFQGECLLFKSEYIQIREDAHISR